MAAVDLPTELHLIHPRRILGHVYLDWMPQPGCLIHHQGSTYTVLERRHRYQLRLGRYQLEKIALYLQVCESRGDRHIYQGEWILGDPTCQFSAHSSLIRCAVNPSGPCEGCLQFQPVSVSPEDESP